MRLNRPKFNELTDAFGVSDQMLATPCSMDWIDYNSVDNQGEVVDFMANLRKFTEF